MLPWDADVFIINTAYLYSDEDEIAGCLEQLITGYEDITSEVLKQTVDMIAMSPTHLIFNCIINRVFPEAVNIGVIRPIYKAGKKLVVADYRSISLISTLDTVFEKKAKKRINDFLDIIFYLKSNLGLGHINE